MDKYANDKFYNTITCTKCSRNVYYHKAKYYCINCRMTLYIPYKRYENRSKVNLKNNCKIIHFKKLLQDLLTTKIPDQLRSIFNKFITDNNITKEKINICIVERFAKFYNFKLLAPIKYQLLNSILFNRDKPTQEEADRAIEVFNIFVVFIHDISPQYTMKYDFYLNKIFNYLQIPYDYSKITYKDNIKNNKDMIYWRKFIKYGISLYTNKETLSSPIDEYNFQSTKESDSEYLC